MTDARTAVAAIVADQIKQSSLEARHKPPQHGHGALVSSGRP